MQDEDVSYYVVFCDSDLKWLKWLKPGFRHCFVMRKEYGKLWTVINDSRYCLDVETYLVEDYPEPQDYARQGSTIIKADKLRANGFRGHICWFNCVEAVKAVLGIRKPFIITPYQLYRWLYGRRAYSRGKTQTAGCGEAAERTDCEAAADSTV